MSQRRRDAAAGYIAGATAGFGVASFAFANAYIALMVFLAGVVVFPLTIWKATQPASPESGAMPSTSREET